MARETDLRDDTMVLLQAYRAHSSRDMALLAVLG